MLKEMNDAMSYIEKYILEDKVLYEKIPQIMGMPLEQFKKIFLLLSGIPLLEYIRKRKMTLAGYDLRERNMKVIDVAIKYQYNSPDSFTKAFYKVHGVNPSDVYDKSIPIKSYSPVTFQLTMTGGSQINYRIEEKKAFKIVGIHKRLSDFYNDVNKCISTMQNKISGRLRRELETLSDMKPHGGYSATYNVTNTDGEIYQCDFMMGTLTTKDNIFHLDTHGVGKSTWAIFTSEINHQIALQELWIRIHTEWLPSSEYELIDDGPIIFFIEDARGMNDSTVNKEIWIQVKKK